MLPFTMVPNLWPCSPEAPEMQPNTGATYKSARGAPGADSGALTAGGADVGPYTYTKLGDDLGGTGPGWNQHLHTSGSEQPALARLGAACLQALDGSRNLSGGKEPQSMHHTGYLVLAQ